VRDGSPSLTRFVVSQLNRRPHFAAFCLSRAINGEFVKNLLKNSSKCAQIWQGLVN
jgi:hypothetical protein